MNKTYSLTLTTPDGAVYHLNAPPTKAVYNMEGWGMSDKDIAAVRTPFQQGQLVLSQRLTTRTVTLSFYHHAKTFRGRWENHTSLIDVLRENRSPLSAPEPSVLTLFYHDGTQYVRRALKVFFSGGTAFPLSNNDQWSEWDIREDLEFTAFDPLVYDPVINIEELDTFAIGLVLPVTPPFVLDAYTASDTIVNEGSWETFPAIKIYGPARNVSILNLSTDKRIDFNYEVAADEVITFNLEEGIKSVTSDCASASLLKHVEGDLGTFSLQCDPLVSDGENLITVYSEQYDPGSTVVAFNYYTRYRGI